MRSLYYRELQEVRSQLASARGRIATLEAELAELRRQAATAGTEPPEGEVAEQSTADLEGRRRPGKR